MANQEKRRSKRLKVNLPIVYEHLGDHRRFGETTSKDISMSGLRMNMNQFYPARTSFLIKLRFPEVNKVIEAIGNIVWSHRISYSDQYQAGLEFSEINPVFRNWLQEYILINEIL
ncbi:MAG: PilZ domain-containing protein [Candidatus Omnitrophota bacterium]